MPFVDVHRRGIDAQCFQDAHSADAEHDLLPQALLGIVGVEPMSDRTVPRLIGFHFGIEQIDWNAANVSAPYQHMNGRFEEWDLNSKRFIVFIEHQFDGIVGAVQSLFVVFLPAIIADFLRKITAGINQTHGDHGDGKVAAFLDVVSGQHAQPAGIERERMMESVLGGKIG